MTDYISTRGEGLQGGTPARSFEDVLLAGMASDGGLYVPRVWPQLSPETLKSLQGKSYADVAFAVMKPYVGTAIPDNDFKKILNETYGGKVFDHPCVTPLVEVGPDLWIMEHFRGPTLAFKDVALQLLGRLFDYVLERRGERITIVGATSGDTGSAAIEACKTCKNIDIFILHPKGRVSEVQRRQMTGTDSPNVHNIALEGTFDDCQNMVKALFADEPFRKSVNLSAINSINWARIMAQVVYYVTTALALGGLGRPVSYAVPTGNFGNIFAAYAAQRMGVNLGNLIVASNRNDILARFFESGTMALEGVEPSFSPSMDIQISSNFERYLFDLTGRDPAALKALMDEFKKTGRFSVSENILGTARGQFLSHRCGDEDTLAIIRKIYEDTGTVIDPHTAVGMAGALAHQNEISGPVVALACAHPAKFPDAVEKAIGIRPALPARLSDLFERKEYLTEQPNDYDTIKKFVSERTRVSQKSAA
ncbi:MAG: threonine synthase [Alphaproteobacteria bacterium]|nr:threonine synthase [Alphaproteobacteria bacterium]